MQWLAGLLAVALVLAGLVAGSQGVVALDTSGGQVGVPVSSVAEIRPVASCP